MSATYCQCRPDWVCCLRRDCPRAAAIRQRQERLGRDFERVLYDNLWDLYARDSYGQ